MGVSKTFESLKANPRSQIVFAELYLKENWCSVNLVSFSMSEVICTVGRRSDGGSSCWFLWSHDSFVIFMMSTQQPLLSCDHNADITLYKQLIDNYYKNFVSLCYARKPYLLKIESFQVKHLMTKLSFGDLICSWNNKIIICSICYYNTQRIKTFKIVIILYCDLSIVIISYGRAPGDSHQYILVWLKCVYSAKHQKLWSTEKRLG